MLNDKSLKINVTINDTDITISRPYRGGGDNPIFFASDFREAVDLAASEIEDMLITKFGDHRK